MKDLPPQHNLVSDNLSDVKKEIQDRINKDIDIILKTIMDSDNHMPPMQPYPVCGMNYTDMDKEAHDMLYMMTRVSYIKNYIEKDSL